MTRYWTGDIIVGVAEALWVTWNILPPFEAATVRCLDSNCDPRDVADVLARFHISLLETNVPIIGPEELKRAIETDGLLVHHDEVWLHETRPAEIAWPAEWRLNEDVDRFMAEAMEATRCVMAMSDGGGLTFATSSQACADRLTSLFKPAGPGHFF